MIWAPRSSRNHRRPEVRRRRTSQFLQGKLPLPRTAMNRSMGMIGANDSYSPSATDVLARLIEGNERFLRGEARNMKFCEETLANLAARQRPFATILGCSDSRVAPELIFDAG